MRAAADCEEEPGGGHDQAEFDVGAEAVPFILSDCTSCGCGSYAEALRLPPTASPGVDPVPQAPLPTGAGLEPQGVLLPAVL